MVADALDAMEDVGTWSVMIHRLGLTENSPPADWKKALRTAAVSMAPEHNFEACLTLARLFDMPLNQAEVLGIVQSIQPR